MHHETPTVDAGGDASAVVSDVPTVRDVSTPPVCAPGVINPGPSPVRRLTRREYIDSVLLLFPNHPGDFESNLTRLMSEDQLTGGFDNNVEAQDPSPPLIEDHLRAANYISTTLTDTPAELHTLMGCNPANAAAEMPCFASWLTNIGRMLFRHPLTMQDVTDFTGLYESTRMGGGDFATGVATTLSALLQSPEFIYRIEFGNNAQAMDGVVPITGYELATRLSFFLWGRTPNSALLDVASRGELDTRDGLLNQARMMMADPQAHNAVADFHRQWLALDVLDEVTYKEGSVSMMGAFNESAVKADLRDSVYRYIDDVFWQRDGTLSTLLLDPSAWVTARIAPLYNLMSPPMGTTWARVDLNRTERAGLLTQPGLMNALAHGSEQAPVLRGVYVLNHFLCAPPPHPDPTISTVVPEPAAGRPATVRQRFEMIHEGNPTCQACHQQIDSVGFGFEHYNAVGRYQTMEGTAVVDASETLSGTDVDGPYNGAVELSQRLARSEQVQRCVVKHWFSFAYGREAGPMDDCSTQQLATQFRASNGNMRDLMVQIVGSNAFRFRTQVRP